MPPKDTSDLFAVEAPGEGQGAGEERRPVFFFSKPAAVFFSLARSRSSLHPPPPASKPAPAADPADAPDPRRLEQRRKQIDMGKNTRGYAAYTAAVPR